MSQSNDYLSVPLNNEAFMRGLTNVIKKGIKEDLIFSIEKRFDITLLTLINNSRRAIILSLPQKFERKYSEKELINNLQKKTIPITIYVDQNKTIKSLENEFANQKNIKILSGEGIEDNSEFDNSVISFINDESFSLKL